MYQYHPIKSLHFSYLLSVLVLLSSTISAKQCIDTKLGRPCKESSDCHSLNELHLFCNKTRGINICAYQIETYIGHAIKNVDCIGSEFSAEPWTNPIPTGLISKGIDCMRMCLHVQTCFGISIAGGDCFLKNEKCFENLKKTKTNGFVGVLNVVREDYRCGCHYPFTRIRSDGQILTWNPDCPESESSRNPYSCCSERGLCIECPGHVSNKSNTNSYY